MEWIISGYCRAQGQARMVMLELEDGQWDCDCSYPDCAYGSDCPIGTQIGQKQEEAP